MYFYSSFSCCHFQTSAYFAKEVFLVLLYMNRSDFDGFSEQ